jgi:hypothetical protein
MKINALVLGFLGLMSVMISNRAAAQGVIVSDPTSVLGPIATGQGSAGIAGALRHDSLFLNPAAATGENLYSLNAAYGATGDLMTASIVDTKSGPVGGGAYYLKRNATTLDPDGFLGNYRRTEEQAGVSIMGMLSAKVGVGVTGRYIRTKLTDINVASKSDWDGDLGIRWLAADGIVLAAVARSMLKEKSGLSPTQYSVGAQYSPFPGVSFSASTTKTVVNTAGVDLDVAVTNPSEKYSYAVGAEWLTTAGIDFRGGMNFLRPWGQKVISAGLGYQSKGLSANYTFSTSTEGAEYSQHLFGLSFEL